MSKEEDFSEFIKSEVHKMEKVQFPKQDLPMLDAKTLEFIKSQSNNNPLRIARALIVMGSNLMRLSIPDTDLSMQVIDEAVACGMGPFDKNHKGEE